MSALMASRDPLIPLQHACAALGMPRATLYRHLKTPGTQASCHPQTQPPAAQRLRAPSRA